MQNGMVRTVDKTRVRMTLFVLVVLPIVIFGLSMCLGRYPVSPGTMVSILGSRIFPIEQTWTGIEESVVLEIRLPRVLLAMLIGAGLATAGTAFQGLFRNPLVSPHLLGVAAGAGFGAALGILISGQTAVVQSFAFVFGLLAVAGAYLLGRLKTGTSLLMLVLAGVIIGAVFSALISLIKYVADPDEKLPAIVYWLMGSLAGASYKDLIKGAPAILGGSLVLFLLRWRINVLSLGEEEAQSLGINVQWQRWIIIIASTIITASAVSLCGTVGWIGLVIPHVGRMLVGPDHRVLLPASISIGAFYLLLIDDVARTATAAEIPLSVLTAIIGAPFFAYLLRKTGGKWM
jgi:iron complex transport system permease protein